jgi:hypothetical protein
MARPVTSQTVNARYLRGRRAAGKVRPSHTADETYWRNSKSRYGVSREFYEKLAVAQGGRCAICLCQPRKRRLGIDHNHALDKLYGPADKRSVRGLLCGQCNHRLLGTARDNVETLQRAVEYLKHPPAERVLLAGILKDDECARVFQAEEPGE